MGPDEGQLCGGDAGSDRFGVTPREEHQRFVAVSQAFDCDDRILTAADRHTNLPRKIDSYRCGCLRRRIRLKAKMAAQRDAISECKFGQAFIVESLEKLCGPFI